MQKNILHKGVSRTYLLITMQKLDIGNKYV